VIEALLLGLFGSLHCIGMCGPIAVALPIQKGENRFIAALQYNFGRILAYSVLGLLFGYFGKGLQISGVQQWVSVVAGTLLIISVFAPSLMNLKSGIVKPLQSVYNLVKKQLSFLFKSQSKFRLFGIGFLNGFLPCGLVYIAIIGAILSPSVIDAVLFMTVFGLGTSPSLAALIFASQFVSSELKQKLSKIVPVFVVILGLLFILRGLGLGIPYLSPPDKVLEPVETEQKCH